MLLVQQYGINDIDLKLIFFVQGMLSLTFLASALVGSRKPGGDLPQLSHANIVIIHHCFY